MIITLVIFCTLVTGIAGMEDMKKVGRVGGKALLYFELVSHGLADWPARWQPRPSWQRIQYRSKTLDARAVAEYAGKQKRRTSPTFWSTLFPTPSLMRLAKEIFCRSCSCRYSSVSRCQLPVHAANLCSM